MRQAAAKRAYDSSSRRITVYAAVGKKPALFRLLIEVAISGSDQVLPAEEPDYVRASVQNRMQRRNSTFMPLCRSPEENSTEARSSDPGASRRSIAGP
jgi:hypothetical protein